MNKILIVDDSPTNIRFLGEMLKGSYDLIVATAGKEALSLAETDRPDLILLDVEMPEMDKFETCRSLKGNPATANIPVIFITAHEGEAKIKAARSAGCYDYITKPFDADRLRRTIERCVNTRGQEGP
jgi:CheY-like chemotaxis protein